MTREEITKTMDELADYIRMENEISVQIENLKTALRDHMDAEGLTELLSDHGSKCYYKPVVSSRFNSSLFRKDGHEDLYKAYCVESTSKPFRFFA